VIKKPCRIARGSAFFAGKNHILVLNAFSVLLVIDGVDLPGRRQREEEENKQERHSRAS
jgi:hypothetical protein